MTFLLCLPCYEAQLARLLSPFDRLCAPDQLVAYSLVVTTSSVHPSIPRASEEMIKERNSLVPACHSSTSCRSCPSATFSFLSSLHHPCHLLISPIQPVRLQQTLARDATLPRIASLQLGPVGHGARLDANHLLVGVVGRKVAHGGRLLLPRVPHDRVGQVVANHVEARLVVDNNGGG